jgi:hypothetical protein
MKRLWTSSLAPDRNEQTADVIEERAKVVEAVENEEAEVSRSLYVTNNMLILFCRWIPR